MFHPTEEQFIALAAEHNLIPVYKEIMADFETPVSAFEKLSDSDHAFLLESVEGGERLARYSLVGSDPYLVATVKNGKLEVTGDRGPTGEQNLTSSQVDNPFAFIKEKVLTYKAPELPDMPPFFGGAVGYMSYDAIRYFENIPDNNTDDLDIPDMYFIFTDKVLIFDHLKHKIKIVQNVDLAANNKEKTVESAREAYRTAVKNIELIEARLSSPISYKPISGTENVDSEEYADVKSNMSKEHFMDMVVKAKEYIRIGDIFQVVVSQRFEMPVTARPFDIYRVLRTVNPSPYMYYLKFKDMYLVGSSPEPLVKVSSGVAETRPIAGTRKRGLTSEEDDRLAKELLDDDKEKAEHIMLVDLGRNDLGRISVPGTVRVEDLMFIEKYSHVQHIVSSVKGDVAEKNSTFDVLQATFPAGTVSGAPKIRAMEIIDELETTKRGTYAGAVGYFGFHGDMDTCITIRTILIKDGTAYVQAGAGIVADSQPEFEFLESQNKARALVKAIKIAEISFGNDGHKEPDATNASRAPVSSAGHNDAGGE